MGDRRLSPSGPWLDGLREVIEKDEKGLVQLFRPAGDGDLNPEACGEDEALLQALSAQKALRKLGARAVLVGRAYAYGLGAAGEAGVARAIEILRSDLERTLKLLGCPSVAALDRSYVNVPEGWMRG